MKYDGYAEICKGFLHQCNIYITHQPEAFTEETTQCAFVMSLLMG